MEREILTQNDGESLQQFKERVDTRAVILRLKYQTKVTRVAVGERRGKYKNKDYKYQYVLRIHLKK